MTDTPFIIDAVAHPYNFREDNYGEGHFRQVGATAVAELAWALASVPPEPKYALPREAYLSDWSVHDTASMLFKESLTDAALIHHLPIYAFKDGSVAIEKVTEAREKYPQRFIGGFAGVDPLAGDEAIRSLERQVELFAPTGLKIYPTSWNGGTLQNWRMDDTKVIFPLLERAQELGIKVVAIHKAVPTGTVPITDAYGTKDVEVAAFHFPDLNFEIVHGGLAFMEETAWVVAQHSNIWINTEVWNVVLMRRPRIFAKLLIDLMNVGGMPILDKLLWGTGTTLSHPRPAIEAFMDFQFPEEMLDGAGLFGPLGQLTDEHKANILGGNLARLHGFDIPELRRGIAGDEFTRKPGQPLPEPYSTTSKAAEIAAASATAGV
jgi:predicted TIM-barrel fold metal-dependent hydrolase